MYVVFICLVVCKLDCLNGGICNVDGICECVFGYLGLFCRIGMLIMNDI